MNDESLKQIVRQIAELAIRTAEAVAPLVERTQPHLGPMEDGPIPSPSPIEIATELQSRASALARLFGIARPIQ
jgi:hypothetical protein